VFFVQAKNAKDVPGAFPRHFGAPVAMALYNQGSGIPVIQMNRMRPALKMGQGWRKGGRFIKTRN